MDWSDKELILKNHLLNLFSLFFLSLLFCGVFFIYTHHKVVMNSNSMYPNYKLGEVLFFSVNHLEKIKVGDPIIYSVDFSKKFPTYKQLNYCAVFLDHNNKCFKKTIITQVKRVIAVSDEVVEIKNNNYYINNKKESLINDDDFLPKSALFFKVNKDIGYHVSYYEDHNKRKANQNYKFVKVPKNSFFVVSDSRIENEIEDWQVFVDKKDVIGVIKLAI